MPYSLFHSRFPDIAERETRTVTLLDHSDFNCGKCDVPTCMVFATRVAEAVKCAGDCSPIEEGKREKLKNYTRRFKLDD